MKPSQDQSTLGATYENVFQIGNAGANGQYSGFEYYNNYAHWYFYGPRTNFSGNIFSANKWVHIALATDGTTVSIYLDGALKVSDSPFSSTTLNLAANAYLHIGKDGTRNRAPWGGSISNFKIWGGVALTAEEVAMEYALGRTGKSLNLTDTALCLGGTVPRAQLDVQGTAMFGNRVDIGTNTGTSDFNPTALTIHELSNSKTTPALTLNHAPFDAVYGSSWQLIDVTTDNLINRVRQCSVNLINYNTTGGGQGNFSGRRYTGMGFSVSNAQSGIQENALAIRYDGNVGIGTASPAAKLHIETSSTSSGSVMRVDASSVTNTGYSEIQMVGPGQTSQGLSIFCNGSGRTTDGGASATTVRNNNGPIILGSSSYVNRIRKPKDDDFICGKWTTTLDASAATTVITNLGSCVSTPSAGGTNMSGNIGRFTAPEDGYYFACCQVDNAARNNSNLLIIYEAGGTDFATNNPDVGTYSEIIDLRSADNVEETYNKVFVMHMKQNNYIQFRVHSSGYIESSSRKMQCYAYLLNRI
jgi:hypothetical protein